MDKMKQKLILAKILLSYCDEKLEESRMINDSLEGGLLMTPRPRYLLSSLIRELQRIQNEEGGNTWTGANSKGMMVRIHNERED